MLDVMNSNAFAMGYQAGHELIAATMASALKGREDASVLCVGVGTGQDILPYARHGGPSWRFTGVDLSSDALAAAQKRLAEAGLLERTRLHAGEVSSLPPGPLFSGAEMIGVIHFLKTDEERLALLREVVRRLEPGAPFFIGTRIGWDPVLYDVEEEILRGSGDPPEQLKSRREALASLPAPGSDAELAELLGRAGLGAPRLIFAWLNVKIFLAHRD